MGSCGKPEPCICDRDTNALSLLTREGGQPSVAEPGEQRRLAAHLGEQACRLQQGHGVQGGQLSAGLLQQRLGAGLDDILDTVCQVQS